MLLCDFKLCIETSVSAPGFPESENLDFGVIFVTRNPGIFWCKTRTSLHNKVPILYYNCEIFKVNAMAFKFPPGGLNLFQQ